MAHKYNSSYQTEMNWVDTVNSKSKNLSLMEGRASNKIHPHMVRIYRKRNNFSLSIDSNVNFVELQTLYNSVIEEKITIEQVNTMGARLAKEAKVC